MTPEQTLDWLAQQHFDQFCEERPIQDWIRKMKTELPSQPAVSKTHKQEPTDAYPTDEHGYSIYSNGTHADIAKAHAAFEALFEPESIWIGTGHLREILNGNTLNAYCSPEQDRFADVQLYTTPYVATPLPPVTESHKRKPLTREVIERDFHGRVDFVRQIEAAHGIYAPTELKEKNT